MEDDDDDAVRRAGIECRATPTGTRDGNATTTKPRDALSVGRDVRAHLESECNANGESRTREMVIATTSGEKIEARAAEGDASGARGKEIVIEIEYETDADSAGIVADERFFSCPGPSRRPASWFPCVERGDALTTFEFSVSAPRELTVVASAHWDKVERCVDEVEDEDGFRLVHHFSGLYPTFAHEMRLICGEFTRVSSPIKGVTLFAPARGGYEERLAVAAAGVGKAIAAYEEYLGHPYPIACLNIVFMPDEYAGARDGLGACINVHSVKWLTHPTFNTALMESRVHIASAIARQWFGGVVVPANTTDCWVVEGLAQYLAGAYVKSLTGMNELSFRRMLDMQLTARMDDGETLPPLASRAARIWRGGQYAGKDPAAGGAPRPLAAGVERALQAKAVTIIYMLEKRLGPDVLQKVLKYFAGLHVRRNKKEQATRAGPSAEVLASAARWIHTQQLFDHCRATVNLGKGEVNSFLERWVYGAGVPKLCVGYVVKRRKNVMEFAVKLEGSEAAAAADRAALAVARNHRSSITVRMREEHRPDANDHVVSLGHSSWQLMDIPLQPRPKDRRPKTIIESGGDPELIAAMDCPVRYVRVDPEYEWMGNIEQSARQIGLESMMAQMLEKEKDVVAQSVAVEFLSRRVANGSVSAVLVLDKCLNSDDTFCRVRAQAALALGKSASEKTQWGGLHALLRHYKKHQCDERTGRPKQNDFRDVAKVIIDEAVITALSHVFDAEKNCTHADALEAIVSRLKYNDNEGNPQSDDGFIASCVAALGRCVPADGAQLRAIVDQIHYYIRRDDRFPSDDLLVTCACVRSIGLLASTTLSEALRADAERVADLGFALGRNSTALAATDAMMYVRYGETKNELAALDFVLERSAKQPSATQSAMLWSAHDYLQKFASSANLANVSTEVLIDLRDRVMREGCEVASAAFSLISLFAARDPSLSEIRESVAEAIKRAGERTPVGIDTHAAHAPMTAEEEAKRAEKEAKRARRRERDRLRQAAREAAEHAHAEERRLEAEAAFVEQAAEHLTDDKGTVSDRTATVVDGGDTPGGGGGLKRSRENASVKSFAQPEDAGAPAPAPAKKLKLSFKMKKPTA